MHGGVDGGEGPTRDARPAVDLDAQAHRVGAPEPEDARPPRPVPGEGQALFVLQAVRARRLREAQRLIAERLHRPVEEVRALYARSHGLLAAGLRPSDAQALTAELGLLGVAAYVTDQGRILPVPPPRRVYWATSLGKDEGLRLRSDLGLHELTWETFLLGVFGRVGELGVVDLVTRDYERLRWTGTGPAASWSERPALPGPRPEGTLSVVQLIARVLDHQRALLHNDALVAVSLDQTPEEPRFPSLGDLDTYEALLAVRALEQAEGGLG